MPDCKAAMALLTAEVIDDKADVIDAVILAQAPCTAAATEVIALRIAEVTAWKLDVTADAMAVVAETVAD